MHGIKLRILCQLILFHKDSILPLESVEKATKRDGNEQNKKEKKEAKKSLRAKLTNISVYTVAAAFKNSAALPRVAATTGCACSCSCTL